MKNLILIVSIFLTTACFGQIEVEEVTPDGIHVFQTFETATVTVTITDEAVFTVQSGGTITYPIENIQTYSFVNEGESVELFSITLSEEVNGITSLIIWKSKVLIAFEYVDGTVVLNSGEGVIYNF